MPNVGKMKERAVLADRRVGQDVPDERRHGTAAVAVGVRGGAKQPRGF